eukprot:CAMPEP_0179161306 /NCGR_PEP_ID=MMETSP0796-20121207/78954_1 /TAXON_ID=73915 /ORGANISM="Pyrodinium bahamense, Strain pbaha01" /LENGTH=50 /DNA_ID=CAMNT_0020863397 /DNA_START=62 /DNA_END=214 /DNA_ORIENTATION=-
MAQRRPFSHVLMAALKAIVLGSSSCARASASNPSACPQEPFVAQALMAAL